MVAKAYYHLILGITTDLKKVLVKTNPDSKGFEDKKTPRYILANADDNDTHNSYVFPDGSIVENLEHTEEINKSAPANELEELTLESDDFWLEDNGVPFQVLGINLESHAGGGYLPADENQIKKGLEIKEKVAEMINKYGFNVTKTNIGLHQVLIPYED